MRVSPKKYLSKVFWRKLLIVAFWKLHGKTSSGSSSWPVRDTSIKIRGDNELLAEFPRYMTSYLVLEVP